MIQIKKQNIASTGRPTEYTGTISIDTISAGKEMTSFIESLVRDYLNDGYYFNGLKIYTGHPREMVNTGICSADILLTKYDSQDETQQNILVRRNINLTEIVSHLTAISIQITSRTDFEEDAIDWDNIERVEED